VDDDASDLDYKSDADAVSSATSADNSELDVMDHEAGGGGHHNAQVLLVAL
jgi:hypothetical protein